MSRKQTSSFISVLAFVLLMSTALLSQNQKASTGTFALIHARVQTVTKGIIENGTVILSDGIIAEVGAGLEPPAGAIVIDCQGLWVYPGMIDSGTHVGLLEIGQIAQASDQSESGLIIPQVKALTAVNPNSVVIPVARVNGVTTVITYPSGGIFPGTAALINLHGYVADQMYAGFEGVVMNFPGTRRRGSLDRRTDAEIKKANDKAMDQLNDVWKKAIQYHQIDSATKGNSSYYPELQALLPVVRGVGTLMIEVNASDDILAALAWVKENKVKKVILTGVSEGWKVADEIMKTGIPVVTGPVLNLPAYDYDRYDRPYSNAGLMKKAGVKVALRTGETENVRNLPYNAGFAAAYGLGVEEALRSVTITPAEIFGVADALGSIEKGKRANLFVTDGDPFETRTQVIHVFIDGWQMPMHTRQTELYEEFLHRTPGVLKH